MGCVVEGGPPDNAIAAGDFAHYLARRSTGRTRHTSARHEADAIEILSGVYEGRTTGTPIALLVRNTDARSKDYDRIAPQFRPGHADYTYWQKYGTRDPRGGGRSPAREARKSTRLKSSHYCATRMPSSACKKKRNTNNPT